MKRNILILAVMMMVYLSNLWAYDFSSSISSDQTLYFNIVDGNAQVTFQNNSNPRYTSLSGAIVIPEQVTNSETGNTYTVTSISNYAFTGCTEITSVTLPNTLTTIGNNAFDGCRGITEVSFRNSLTTIGNFAFRSCILLANIVFPTSLERIGEKAFDGCTSLTSITIPSGVTSIGSQAFVGCTSITAVTYNARSSSYGNGDYGAFHNCNHLTSASISNGVESIPQTLFAGTPITSISIPSSVTAIGNSAFKNCTQLGTVNYNARNINQIGGISVYVFNGCNSIETVVIGPDAERIPKYAFFGATKSSTASVSLTIDFSNATSLTSIGASAFRETKLTNVVIPNTVTTIESEAFKSCSQLESFVLGSGINSIGDEVFQYCALREFTIPESVRTIGQWGFRGCTNLHTVHFNAIACTSFGNRTNTNFSGCTSLTHIDIGPGVTSIPDASFYNCSQLTSVIVPATVTSLNSNAFSYCSQLTLYNCTNQATINNVKRHLKCSNHGTGANAIHRIDKVNNNTSYSVVADDLAADGQNDAQEIPESTLPDNFIYSNDNGITWRAKNIVLTDCEDAFNAPVAFIAESATYTRVLTDQNRSTLCLPFTVAKPDDLEVFEYVAFDNSTLSFLELEGENIVAYTPYLVGKNISSAAKATSTFVFSQSNAEFPATSLTEVTHNNMTFKGAMERTPMTSDRNYGYKDGYFVQSGGSAHVNPFRCYFTDNNPQPNPSSLGVDITENGRLGIDEVHPSSQMIIRYSNDVYDLMGRMVRKNAESLRGLPNGIYIWKGQKVFNNR